MSESFIEPDSLNATLLALGAVVDENGSTRFINKELASYNFDGMIPTSSDTILVNELEVGMSFLPIGETEGSLKTVIKIDFDDPEMTGSPTNDYIISYLGTNGEIETVVYDGDESIEVYFEDWDDKVLGDNGWIITQEGNAIFSNVAVRGRIEATEGFIDGDLIVTGSLSTSETADTEGGVVFDSTGILAYDTDGNNTFWLDATTGDITIFGTPGDDLLTGEDVGEAGTTTISGSRITTGTIRSNNFVGTANGANYSTTGMAINLTDGSITSEQFRIDTSGNAFFAGDLFAAGGTFEGTLSAVDGTFEGTLSAVDGTFEGTLSAVDGTFEGDVIGGTFKSNSSITANSGDGVYLDDFGQVRFSDPDATLTFNANGLTITNNANTSNLTFNSSGLSLSGTGLSITGADIYLTGGSLISDEFSIDSLGNATFSGEIAAGVSITSPTITGGSISGATISSQSPAFPSSYITLTDSTIRFYDQNVLVGGIFGDNAGGTLWAQPDLTVNGDITAFGNISVFPGGSRRFSGNGSGLTGTATSLSIGGTSGGFTAGNASNLNTGIVPAARVENVSPAIFSNSQAALQVRTSDGRVGTFSSIISIKENIISLTGIQSSVVTKEKDGTGRSKLVSKPENIFSITPVEYSIVDESTSIKEVGFIVEDLLEKWPSAVIYDKNNKPFSYNTNSIVAGLVYAVKTLKDRIDYLENKINELEG
jgi:hypothetical protein